VASPTDVSSPTDGPGMTTAQPENSRPWWRRIPRPVLAGSVIVAALLGGGGGGWILHDITTPSAASKAPATSAAPADCCAKMADTKGGHSHE
jgi:hypothetical protein